MRVEVGLSHVLENFNGKEMLFIHFSLEEGGERGFIIPIELKKEILQYHGPEYWVIVMK